MLAAGEILSFLEMGEELTHWSTFMDLFINVHVENTDSPPAILSSACYPSIGNSEALTISFFPFYQILSRKICFQYTSDPRQ